MNYTKELVAYFVVLVSVAFSWPQETRIACIDDNISFRGKLDGDCTNPILKWQFQNGTRIPSSTKYVISPDEYGLSIKGVQPNDDGNYTLRQSCLNGGLKFYVIRLKVNCQYRIAYEGSTVSLSWPKPAVIPNKVDMKVRAKFAHNNYVRLVLNGNPTEQSKEMFGKRLKIDKNDHTLRIEKIRANETGNYTIIWRWTVNKWHPKTKSFMYSIKIKVATKRPPTAKPTPTSYSNNSIVVPTGHKIAHGEAKRLVSYGCLLIIAVWLLLIL